MPKFGISYEDEPSVAKPAMDQIPAATKGAAAQIPTSYVDSGYGGYSRSAPAPQVQQLSEASCAASDSC